MIATTRKSTPALHRSEKAAFRAMTETFRTMLLIEKGGCDDATYLRISALYREQCEEHSAICADLTARYEAHLIARHEEEEVGSALQADRSDFGWDSSMAD
ncbi:MAG TPA: hypothetical protein VIL85_23115 [Thermomicrobiales bacterium]|jgi:GTP cyclohydrolase II